MNKFKFDINGMHCPSCQMLIKEALMDENVEVLSLTNDADLQKGHIKIQTDKSREEVISIIEGEGDYEVE